MNAVQVRDRIKQYLKSYADHEKLMQKYFGSEKRKTPYKTSFDNDKVLKKGLQAKCRIIRVNTLSNTAKEFIILSSTSKNIVYFVIIGEIHFCTCYEHANKGHLCKHIIFVLTKIIGMDTDSELIYQFGLTKWELGEIFGRDHEWKNYAASKEYVEKYNIAATSRKGVPYVIRESIHM
eukprot:61791_1